MDHLIDDDIVPRERELTLSTGAILGIFLGLVILCGAFFAFGYNLGRKSVPTPLALNEIPEATAPSSTAKPSAGTLADEGTPAPSTPTVAPARPVRHPAAPQPATDAAAPTVTERPKPVARPVEPTPAPIVRPPAPAAAAAAPPVAPTGVFLVQVAAVSHKEDADLLVGALRGRGYAVAARTSAADSFIHIQIGPFATKKDAEAMRQRLIGDGYNAIVK